MRKIITILFCLLFLTSCIYSAMYHLSENDKKWVYIYNKNDIYLFRSDENIDTLLVEDIDVKDSKSPFMQSEASSIYNGNSSLLFTIKHKGVTISGMLLIVKEKDDILYLSLRVGKRKYSSTDTKKIILSSISIVGREFIDVISVDSINSKNLLNDMFTPKSYLWSKSKGLLQYEFENGETYTLYKKISH